MSITLAPINSAPASQQAPVPASRPPQSTARPEAPAAPAADTVQLSTIAQSALTPSQTIMQEMDTHAQIVQAADNDNPQAISLLAAETARAFM
jgi:hypothetical protein